MIGETLRVSVGCTHRIASVLTTATMQPNVASSTNVLQLGARQNMAVRTSKTYRHFCFLEAVVECTSVVVGKRVCDNTLEKSITQNQKDRLKLSSVQELGTSEL